MNYKQVGDPETHTRIQQYELAFRMQSSVPELTDIANEPESTYKLYGDDAKKPGTFANTRPARPPDGRTRRPFRADLSQQLGHARQRRRPPAHAVQRRRSGLLRLVQDLKATRPARLNAGHLGRRVRPHDLFARRADERELRPRPSSALLHDVDGRRRLEAGRIYGETDDFSYNIVKDPVHIHDFHATVLHLSASTMNGLRSARKGWISA